MDVKCPKLKVSGGPVSGEWLVDGTYIITALKAGGSPSRPVYKRQGSDKYIFHYPSSEGWRIGSYTGTSWYFKSKYVLSQFLTSLH